MEARLDDGTRVLFRPIRPDDRQRLAAGMARLSPESRYRRFFRHIDRLTEKQLSYLTEIDGTNHFALIATLPDAPGEPGVGVGRWVRIEGEPTVAEGAVTVLDDYQGKGIGKTLLWLLAKAAIENGITAFRAWTLGENEPMLSLLKELGARPGRWQSGVMEVTVPLPGDVAELERTPAPLVLKATAEGAIDAYANPREIAGTRLTPKGRESAALEPRSPSEAVLDPYRFRLEPTMTGPEVAGKAGLEYETARRIWRALGFPELDETMVEFDDRDAEALGALKHILDVGLSLEDLLSMARVYGQALSRIADAETRVFRKRFIEPFLDGGASVEDVERRADSIVPALLDLTATPLDVAHRRHLSMAAQSLSLAARGETVEQLAVGFVDLVDFTRLSDDLDVEDLGGVVTHFEEVATTRCSDLGVKLVKVIGDAVMFVSTEPVDVLETAAAIVADAATDPVLPEARAGLGFGPTLPVAGDYFGRPVNLASRLAAFARPGTIVIDQDFLDALPDGYAAVSAIGAKRIKGLGHVRLYKLRASEPRPVRDAADDDAG